MRYNVRIWSFTKELNEERLKILIEEFDKEKNDIDSYQNYKGKTTDKVWWRCEKNHEWQATIANRKRGTGCPVCSGKKIIEGENDFATLNQRLVKEWDFEKNELNPSLISCSNRSKVFWKCSKGHNWRQEVAYRAKTQNKCPVCTGVYISKGKNDFASKYPGLIKFWDFEKNTIGPDEVKPKSEKKVNWKCDKGHKWQQAIFAMALSNKGCPYCRGRAISSGENDLATLYPELMKEWDFEKNEIDPSRISAYSIKKVYWKCKKNHSFVMSINHKTRRKDKCPYCYGRYAIEGENDLMSVFPSIAKEWDYQKNEKAPYEYTAHSNKKVWWRCKENHSYDRMIKDRVRGFGCPYCSGKKPIKGINDLKTLQPELMMEWDYESNANYDPETLLSHSNKKVFWRCKMGHTWKAAINNRVKGKGCPECYKINR